MPLSRTQLATPIPTRESTHASQKQLCARRGSVSAPDPHGTRTTPPPRNALSRLTVVRVPPPKICSEEVKNSGRKVLARQGPTSPTRLSFASASFSLPSPTSAQPLRSLSPSPSIPSPKLSSTASAPSSPCPLHRLSPNQIYDLAKVSSKPAANMIGAGGASPASPASFVQLVEGVYLPFVDRPSEVHALISNGENAKLMVLFSKALPPASENHLPVNLAVSPAAWTFNDLKYWLSQIPRTEVNDLEWVRGLQCAILPRSEVLWERMKGMLGVPHELDVSSLHLSQVKGAHDEYTISINEIHTVPFLPVAQLDDISEAAEDSAGPADAAHYIVGLRMSTSFSVSSRPLPSSDANSSLRPRVRTSSQTSIPAKSSPLVPKAQSPSSTPSPSSSSLRVLQTQRLGIPHAPTQAIRTRSVLPPSRNTASPMFPASFAQLRVPPMSLSSAA
ncbi:hypothetical protein EW145_g4812 [Phellinidium pouzarii]|uniref:Uncharacterized protein n=1 Tax=Phellinidium pouzarii TaxID=167371 RepID=A0A4S4L2D4_9AGAM|nr:hypothetical protein EW145_g4812 [Phellinidium pouzarii]